LRVPAIRVLSIRGGQDGGSCQPACPGSAPEYPYPPAQQSCKGKKCCVAQCQEPSWLCNSSRDCKEGEVCTVDLGACDVSPCCPICAACYGCCRASAFSVKVTSASAGADLMPGGPGKISATLELKLDNRNSYAVSDVEVLKSSGHLGGGEARLRLLNVDC